MTHFKCKLIIFVSSLSVDSLCAAKILSDFFKKELIMFQIIPVVGYSNLKKHFFELDEDICNVILMGCGSLIDLESFFEIEPLSFLKDNESFSDEVFVFEEKQESSKIKLNKMKKYIFVIDGNRPWNLNNIFGSQIIVCFDDGFIDSNLSKEKETYFNFLKIEQKTSKSDTIDTETDGESDSNDLMSKYKSSSIPLKKRLNTNIHGKKKKKKIDSSNYEYMIQNYYNKKQDLFTSNTAIVYGFLSEIGESNHNNLWISIIGTTSLINQNPDIYEKIQPLYKDEALRLKPSNGSNKNKSPFQASSISSTLISQKDYHLFLLHHWDLYNSFFYSSYVNSKLNLWTEQGKKKLHKLFASMGIPLTAAKQKWLYMDSDIKKKLPFIFNKYLPLCGLNSIFHDGFIRTFGHGNNLTAIDCVEGLTALLELNKKNLYTDLKILHDPLDLSNTNQLCDDDEIQKSIEISERNYVESFWSAWDALSFDSIKIKNKLDSKNQLKNQLKGLDLLFLGIEKAKQLQKIIFESGSSILERKLIKNLISYRLCVLSEKILPDIILFNNPLILTKLGLWLLKNLIEIDISKNEYSFKHLIIASLNLHTNMYLVINLIPIYPKEINDKLKKKKLSEKIKSHLVKFSIEFQKLSNSFESKLRLDNFNSWIVQINKNDFASFLEKLSLSEINYHE